MSMRSSRINLQEDLRHILEQEAKLDNDVWMLLQPKHSKHSKSNGSSVAATSNGGATNGIGPDLRAARRGLESDGGAHANEHASGEAGDFDPAVGLDECLAELSATMPDFPGLEEKAGALLAQIEDGHGMAERVSRSVRRLDDIQMRVQRALALVEDVINLRGCAQGVRTTIKAGRFSEACEYVRRFREIDAGALADSHEMVEMDAAVEGLSSAVLERFQTAALEMDEKEIASACPLMAPLGLAPQGQELYLGFARRKLEEELITGVDEVAPATERLPAIYNVSAAFLRRQVPVAAAGLAPCLGDVALVRVVTRECGDRAATVLETHLREKSVSSIAAKGVGAWSEGGSGSSGDGGGAGAAGGDAATMAATAKALGQADILLEELATLTQHSERYDRFVRFLVEEVESTHPARGHAAGQDQEGPQAGRGQEGLPSVVPAPLTEPIMPARTRLQEAGAEVAAFYSQIEGQLLSASVAKAVALDEISSGSPASSCAEDAFYVAQRCAKRALATGNAGAASTVMNHVGNTLGVDLLEALVRKVKSSLGTLPAGGGGTLDLTIKQLGQIDFTDLASLKNQLQMDNWEGMGAGLASDITSSATAAISTIRRTGVGAVAGTVPGTVGAGGGGAGAGIPGGGGGVMGAGAGAGVSADGAGGGTGRNNAGLMGENGLLRSECLIFVNTLEACSRFSGHLKEVLKRDAAAAFGGAGHDEERVMLCLEGLESTGAVFSRAACDCLEEVLNRLRPVLRTVVASHLGEKSAMSYQLSENQYATNEAEDPFAHALVEYLRFGLAPILCGLSLPNLKLIFGREKPRRIGDDPSLKASSTYERLLLEPYRPPDGLSESLFLELLTLVAGYLAKRLELALKRRVFTQLGGLQLDKDLRCVMGFFTQQAGRAAKEPFARLAQVSMLLNLERPQTAADYWEPGSPLQAQLTADEVIAVLHQREDFSREDLVSTVLP